MLIDTHIHTKRCHHAEGDLEDYIIEAIKKGIKIIGFSEHAPLHFDLDKRLTQEESIKYLKDINRLKMKYKNKIKILAGFEIDYIEGYETQIKDFIDKTNADFYLGSIHFISLNEKIFTIWDYKEIQHNKILQHEYFRLMIKAIKTKLFNSISHPDLIFRAGFNEISFRKNFEQIFKELVKNNVCYEINCSGMFKTKYNPQTDTMDVGGFFNKKNLFKASKLDVQFTIGSDAHKIEDCGKGIKELTELVKLNKLKVVFFKNCKKQEIKI